MLKRNFFKLLTFVICLILIQSINIIPTSAATSTSSVVNIKDFGAHSIDENGYSNFDSSNAINNAIEYAANNNISTIDFGKGKYYAKNVYLESNITYLSTQGAELIASPDIEIGDSIFQAWNKQNITIQGLTFNGNWDVVPGNDQYGSKLIAFFYCQNVSVQKSYLYHNKYVGILLAGTNYATIKNNTIYDTDCGVVSMGDASNNLLIDSNNIYGGKNQQSEPISIYNSTDKGLAHDITITNNTLHDKRQAAGIYVGNATKVTVKNNSVYNCAQGINTNNVDHITITGNNIHDTIYGGMLLQASYSTISGNTINGIGGTGIWLSSTAEGPKNNNNTISQNKITNVNSGQGAQEAGIRLQYSNNSVVNNNSITDTRTKPMTYSNIQVTGDNNYNNTIQNNINLGNTVNKNFSILIYEANKTSVKNNIAYITDGGIGTILVNNKQPK